MNNGKGLNLTKNKCVFARDEVQAGAILVDGLGVGDVGNIVFCDRKLPGVVIVVYRRLDFKSVVERIIV